MIENQDDIDWLSLTITCRTCQYVCVKDKINCKDCKGKGYFITNLGIQILDFVSENLMDYKDGKFK